MALFFLHSYIAANVSGWNTFTVRPKVKAAYRVWKYIDCFYLLFSLVACVLDLFDVKPEWIRADLSPQIMWCGIIIEKKIVVWGRWREWTVKCSKKCIVALFDHGCLFVLVFSLHSGLIIFRSRLLLWHILFNWKSWSFYNFPLFIPNKPEPCDTSLTVWRIIFH